MGLKTMGLLALVALTAVSCRSEEPAEIAPAPTVTVTVSPSATPSVTARPVSLCANESSVVEVRRFREPGEVTADVDGDGTDDVISIYIDPDATPGCQAFLVAETGGGLISGVMRYDPAFGLTAPRLAGAAEVNGVPGSEIVVDMGAGASTQFAGLFTYEAGALVQIEVRGGDPNDLFAYGGSVGHVEAVDCTQDGLVVVSAALPQADEYLLTRSFFAADGALLLPLRGEEQRIRIRLEELDRYPEFAHSPFGGCPSS
ncbi:MAG TPA: hypothetical protein VNC78_09780 [Actinomycetota bacterium]|nr:hypothetical protein [Actinomycetota bacterium]